MAWKALIEYVEVAQSGAANVAVTFVDEQAGRKEARRVQVPTPTLENVKAALRRERSLVDAVYAAKLDLPAGELDIDAPDAPPVTDPDAIARAAYLAAYNHYRAVRAQLADGLVDQAAVDTAFSDLQKAFKPEYIGVL